MGGQVVHQVAGQLLDVQNIVLHRTRKGKTLADFRIVKFRPEDAGGVQQLQGGVHGHPLLGAGNAGAILGLGGLALGHLVDEGGLAHVGDAQHHDADHAAHLTLGGVGLQLITEQLTDGGGEFLRAHAALGVGLQHGPALGAEILRPAAGLGGVGLVGTVEDDEAWLARRQVVHVRVAGGQGDAGVQYLADGVHVGKFGRDHALCFCHVAGKPAEIFDLHSVHLAFGLL